MSHSTPDPAGPNHSGEAIAIQKVQPFGPGDGIVLTTASLDPDGHLEDRHSAYHENRSPPLAGRADPCGTLRAAAPGGAAGRAALHPGAGAVRDRDRGAPGDEHDRGAGPPRRPRAELVRRRHLRHLPGGLDRGSSAAPRPRAPAGGARPRPARMRGPVGRAPAGDRSVKRDRTDQLAVIPGRTTRIGVSRCPSESSGATRTPATAPEPSGLIPDRALSRPSGTTAAQRGRAETPIRNSSTARAAWRPSRIAHTTSDWPRRMSPAVNTLSTEVR